MKILSPCTTAILLATTLTLAAPLLSRSEKPGYTKLTNAQVASMLDEIEKDIQENYYDPSMHGLDLHKRFDEARAKVASAQSQDDALLVVAAAVASLKDSHTRFNPPARPYSVDYGFMMQAFGDSACYVTAVRQGSDAEAKGLKRGDQVLAINGVRIVRQDIATVQYGYRVFPQSGFHMDIQSPDAPQRTLTVLSKVIPGQKYISEGDISAYMSTPRTRDDRERAFGMGNQSRLHPVDKKVLFWKLPNFVVDPQDLADQASKARAYQTLVLDLRGNPGGIIDTLSAVLGEFFEHDVTIGNQQTRKGLKPLIAKGHGSRAFHGKLIVLIDSNSASSAEIFARVIQLEKRGTVLGDRSSGMVMESRRYIHAVKLDPRNVTQYGASVTMANLIMTDGNSLENNGVVPDERILPTAADLAAGRDPVLARAATLSGIEMTPEQAGQLFPFQWPEKEIVYE